MLDLNTITDNSYISFTIYLWERIIFYKSNKKGTKRNKRKEKLMNFLMNFSMNSLIVDLPQLLADIVWEEEGGSHLNVVMKIHIHDILKWNNWEKKWE